MLKALFAIHVYQDVHKIVLLPCMVTFALFPFILKKGNVYLRKYYNTVSAFFKESQMSVFYYNVFLKKMTQYLFGKWYKDMERKRFSFEFPFDIPF